MLALHGWLDNSASFDLLAPRLAGVHLLALDMAGHGHSEHRPGSTPYNLWEDVAEVFAIADHLGWPRFTLLGHSRGAIVATLAAGTFPDRVARLAALEGFFPEPASPERAPTQLAASIEGVRAQMGKSQTTYSTIEQAAKARESGVFPLGADAARRLTERGLKQVPGGYQWCTDRRLLAPSAIGLTREQIAAFVGRIAAPTCLVLADEGLRQRYPRYLEEAGRYPGIQVTLLPGGHHLHMEGAVSAVAERVNAFLTDHPV